MNVEKSKNSWEIKLPLRSILEQCGPNRIYFTDLTVQIIVPIVVVFCIVLICVIAYIMWRHRQNARKHQLRTNQFPLEEQNPPQDVVNELEPMILDGTDEVNG